MASQTYQGMRFVIGGRRCGRCLDAVLSTGVGSCALEVYNVTVGLLCDVRTLHCATGAQRVNAWMDKWVNRPQGGWLNERFIGGLSE